MIHLYEFSNREIGKELKKQIDCGLDIVRISRWAYGIIFDYRDKLNPDLKEILTDISIMEDDPQFECTEEELRFIANVLIDNESFKKKINRINDLLDDPEYAFYWKNT